MFNKKKRIKKPNVSVLRHPLLAALESDVSLLQSELPSSLIQLIADYVQDIRMYFAVVAVTIITENFKHETTLSTQGAESIRATIQNQITTQTIFNCLKSLTNKIFINLSDAITEAGKSVPFQGTASVIFSFYEVDDQDKTASNNTVVHAIQPPHTRVKLLQGIFSDTFITKKPMNQSIAPLNATALIPEKTLSAIRLN